VTVIKLSDDEKVVGVDRIPFIEGLEEEGSEDELTGEEIGPEES
jgi:hypothetical protein